MTESHHQDANANAPQDGEVRYPENSVVGLLDTAQQLASVAEALKNAGFLPAEIEVIHGARASEKLRENTGRTGWAHLVMRFAESIGLPNDETAMKNAYADALGNGQLLITVHTPSEEQRQMATRLLQEQGATSVKFLGKYTIESSAHAG